MAEHGDDVFEIEDFTIVTLKEGLTAELEQLLRKWSSLIGSNPTNQAASPSDDCLECCVEWESFKDILNYGNHALNVSFYRPKKNYSGLESTNSIDASTDFMPNAARQLLSPANDFCAASLLAKQFGVLEFILLTPFDALKDNVCNENQLRDLLSVFADASSKAACHYPMFLQFDTAQRQLFYGLCQNTSMRIQFDAIHTFRFHPLKCHLSGCVEIFEEALLMSNIDTGLLRVSVQFDYFLKDQAIELENYPISLEHYLPSNNLFIVDVMRLPFGVTSEPIDEFQISAVWSNFPARTLHEDQHKSSMDPNNASYWKASVSFHEQVVYLLYSCLKKLLFHIETEGELRVADPDSNLEAHQALSAIVLPAALPNIKIADASSHDPSALDSETSQHWINAIFDIKNKRPSIEILTNDVKMFSNNSAYLAPGGATKEIKKFASSDESENVEDIDEQTTKELDDILSNCKSSPENCLSTRIAIALARILSDTDSLMEFRRLWSAIVDQLRDLFVHNNFLPGMSEDPMIDLSVCKLHQRLQFLQCATYENRNSSVSCSSGNKSTIPDGDLFFDAVESIKNSPAIQANSQEANDEALGRLKPLQEMRLLHSPQQVMYEPITRIPVQMTEDMLERHALFLASLGDSNDRMKAQLKPLISDMSAFKAANPGCCFEDFVRWHSPRDFIMNEETGKGSLSNRMIGESNTWLEAWQEAEAKPVKQQKMLLDYAKETNLIFNEFDNITVAELLILILPVVFTHAAKQLVDEAKPFFRVIRDRLINLCSKIAQCTHNSDIEEYLEAIRMLKDIEAFVSKCNVLYSQITSVTMEHSLKEVTRLDIRQFVTKLVHNSESKCELIPHLNGPEAEYIVPIILKPSDPVSKAIKFLFFPPKFSEKFYSYYVMMIEFRRDEKRTFDMVMCGNEVMPHRRRHYSLHLLTRRPGAGSRPVPHRLYALFSKNENRLCLALSNDTVLS